MILASLSSSVHGHPDWSVFVLLAAATVFFVAALLSFSTTPKPWPAAWACLGLTLVAIGLAVA